MTSPEKQHDDKQCYCRKLGHHLTFAYCRTTEGDIPCEKISDCWFETFDIVEFMKTHYPEASEKAATAPGKPKMLSLLELIEQARKR